MLIENQIEINGVAYEICGEIGEGGVGHVFVAKDSNNNKFALKVVGQYGRNPIIKQLVDKQIQVQSLFANDPHIINLIANKVENKKMFIVLELGSCSLRNIMAMEAHIELPYFLSIATAVCRGVMSIHSRGFIHRDIKPENIISVQNFFKITDFGSLQEGTTADGLIGTPLYLAPEMIASAQQYGQGIDVWSLGVSLFEAYFKIHPFYYSKQSKPYKQVMKQLKNNIEALTPQFTVQRLLTHLQSLQGYKYQCESIHNKLLVTPQQLLTQFQFFFMSSEQRPGMKHFVTVFENIQNQVNKSKGKQCHLTQNFSQIPQDIQSYIIAINTFYSLVSKYGTKNQSKIQLCLESAIKFWSNTNHKGKRFIEYHHQNQIDEFSKDQGTLWQEVRGTIYSYWLELSTNQQLTFFQELPILKVRMLICGARYRMKSGLSRFLKTVSSKLDRSIKSIEELDDLLTGLEMKDLRRIEDSLIHQYYNK